MASSAPRPQPADRPGGGPTAEGETQVVRIGTAQPRRPDGAGKAGAAPAGNHPAGAEETQVVRVRAIPTGAGETQVVRPGGIPAGAEETQVVRARTIPTEAQETQVVRPGGIPAGAEETQVLRARTIPTDAEQTQVVPARPDRPADRSPRDGSARVDDDATQVFRAVTAPLSGSGGQRDQGTLYDGHRRSDLGQRTIPALPVSVENSGSLTGHILAQGWSDSPAQRDHSPAKVVIALVVGLGLVVLVGLLIAGVAADAFRSLFGGALGH
jgi:hypothetical protein